MLDRLRYKFDIINRSFPDIIYGGCGIFAWTLSDIFTKRGIGNNIFYVLEKNIPVGSYRCDVKFKHFFVCVNVGGINFYIDSSGVYLYSDIIRRYDAPLFQIGLDKLGSMLLDKRLWNSKFSFDNWNRLSNLMYKIM